MTSSGGIPLETKPRWSALGLILLVSITLAYTVGGLWGLW